MSCLIPQEIFLHSIFFVIPHLLVPQSLRTPGLGVYPYMLMLSSF